MADNAKRALPAKVYGKLLEVGENGVRDLSQRRTGDPRDEDPRNRISKSLPPNLGQDILPHVYTAVGLYRSMARVYQPSDEAIRDSWDHARFMRNDLQILECLEQRQRSCALLDWHLDIEDDKNAREVEVRDTLTKILKRIPRFMQYRQALLEALWYGRAGVTQRYRWDLIDDKMRLKVDRWLPVHGDKLVFRYDDGSGTYVDDQVGIRVGFGYDAGQKYGRWKVERIGKTDATYQGLAYFLEDWERPMLAIHKHLIEDGEFETPEYAGKIHGVGIRSKIYWCWYQKQEALAWMMEYLERSAFGIEIWYYPAGNPQAKEQTKTAALERIGNGRTVVLVPAYQESEAWNKGVQRIEPGMAGVDSLDRILREFFGWQIKRYILGQTLTSEAGSTGLGSNLASIHLDTYLQIVKYDATNLEETLTEELVKPLLQFNYPHLANLPIRFGIETESPDVEGKLKGWQSAYEMGCRLKESDVMDLIGASMPQGDEPYLINPNILQARAQQQQMEQQAAQQQQPGAQPGMPAPAAGQQVQAPAVPPEAAGPAPGVEQPPPEEAAPDNTQWRTIPYSRDRATVERYALGDDPYSPESLMVQGEQQPAPTPVQEAKEGEQAAGRQFEPATTPQAPPQQQGQQPAAMPGVDPGVPPMPPAAAPTAPPPAPMPAAQPQPAAAPAAPPAAKETAKAPFAPTPAGNILNRMLGLKMLGGSQVRETQDGHVEVRTRQGGMVKIRFGDDDEIQKAAEENPEALAASGGGLPAGYYVNGQIVLRKDATGDEIGHELVHGMEDLGLISPEEIEQAGGPEEFASAYQDWIRQGDKAEANGVFQRVADFVRSIFGDRKASLRRTFRSMDQGRFANPSQPMTKVIPGVPESGINSDGTVNVPRVQFATRKWREWLYGDVDSKGKNKGDGFMDDPRAKEIFGEEGLANIAKGMSLTASVFGNFGLLPEELGGTPIRKNADPLFGATFDLSTTCPQQDEYVNTIRALQEKYNRVFVPEERYAIGRMMAHSGKQPACWYCYGQTGRDIGALMVSKVQKAWTGIQQAYKSGKIRKLDKLPYDQKKEPLGKIFGGYAFPHGATAKVKARIAAGAKGAVRSFADQWWKDPEVTALMADPSKLYDVAMRPSGVKGGSKAERAVAAMFGTLFGSMVNKPKGWSSYKRQILDMDPEWVQRFNNVGGLRLNSQSDFRAWHTLETAQAMVHMQMKGTKAHVYTRKTEFLDIFGDTGLKFNMSAGYAHNVDGSHVIREDGKRDFDMIGMSRDDATKYRERYKNAGTMLVALNPADLQAAFEDDGVDMTIPYHGKKGQAAGQMGAEHAVDFTSKQEENWDGFKGNTTKRVFVYQGGSKDNEEAMSVTNKLGDTLLIARGERLTREHHRNSKDVYLDLCDRLGIQPRFKGVTLPNGMDATEHPGYMKCVRDVARDNDLPVGEDGKPVDLSQEQYLAAIQDNIDATKINWDAASAHIDKWMQPDTAGRAGKQKEEEIDPKFLDELTTQIDQGGMDKYTAEYASNFIPEGLGPFNEAAKKSLANLAPKTSGLTWEPAAPTGLAAQVQDAVDEATGEAPASDMGKQFQEAISAFKPEDVAVANATSRAGGAVGANAIVPRHVEKTSKPGDTILDFGAGSAAQHAKRLRDSGLNVTAHEFGANAKEGVHDPDALSRKYSTVYASNVLNVQSSPEMLRNTLQQIKGSTGGRAIFNYPMSPRKSSMNAQQVAAEIEQVFGEAPKRIGGTASAPMWEAKTGKPTSPLASRFQEAMGGKAKQVGAPQELRDRMQAALDNAGVRFRRSGKVEKYAMDPNKPEGPEPPEPPSPEPPGPSGPGNLPVNPPAPVAPAAQPPAPSPSPAAAPVMPVAPVAPPAPPKQPKAKPIAQPAAPTVGQPAAPQVPSFRLSKSKSRSGEGVYHSIIMDRKRVGHIGGFERPDGVFDLVNTELNEDRRGQGIWQNAVQNVADMYENGLRSLKFQTGKAASKAFRKIPSMVETEKAFSVPPRAKQQPTAAAYAREGFIERYARDEFENQLDEAIRRTETNPSEAQKESGNYPKGKFRWKGLEIAVENPAGSTRRGVGRDGKPWSCKMPHHYGYIKKTESEADGDHVDVFFGPHPDSDRVFVIDQEDGDGNFDEHKCCLGFTSTSEAQKGYTASYEPGAAHLGEIHSMSLGEFKDWLEEGDTGKPFAGQEELKGGRADGRPDSDFDLEQLLDGIRVEYEHTGDFDTAKEIAKDHLAESPRYYRDLKKMEGKEHGTD